MERDVKLTFKSYDRLFPNQDYLPEGGLGNLVALPLQGQARKLGNSVFVDEDFVVLRTSGAICGRLLRFQRRKWMSFFNGKGFQRI